jgi:hypothetical protein
MRKKDAELWEENVRLRTHVVALVTLLDVALTDFPEETEERRQFAGLARAYLNQPDVAALVNALKCKPAGI